MARSSRTKPGAKENEGLIKGMVDASDVLTKGQMKVHKFMSSPGMKLVTAYAIYQTAVSMFNAIGESIAMGDPRIAMREGIAQATSWGLAIGAGAVAFKLVGALALGGVSGVLLTLGSIAVVGYLGYNLGTWFANSIMY